MAQDGLLNLIDGVWREPRRGRMLELFNPATGAFVGDFRASRKADVSAAVDAAAQSGWEGADRATRLAALDGLIHGLDDARGALAEVIAAEIGAPPQFADAGHIGAALGHMQAYRDALSELPEEEGPWGDPMHRVRFEPLGVAALITPWNWPLNQVALKVGAALAAGCSMVLKPSELTPRTSVAFAEVMVKVMAGIGAPGVFNMVLGDAATGGALVRHPGVSAVSFTGSTRAGRDIASGAGHCLKTVMLELGGKSPNILFADCDAALAVSQGVAHCFRNGGQSCNAAARMIVERPIYEKVVRLAAEAAAEYRPGVDYGPIITTRHLENVLQLIESGVTAGARVVAGGPGKATEVGYFPRATVFADVKPGMAIWRTEIFGPVLTITPFDTEDEAIRLANDTEYGLAGYIQTADAARADRVAKALNVGMVQVNGSSRAPGAPFGGVKASGLGREGGRWGIRAFQSAKSISGAPSSDH